MKYVLAPTKRHRLSLTGRILRYFTNRPEDEDVLLRPPRTYDRTQATVQYQRKLFKGNKTIVQSYLRHNKYLTDPERVFYYKAWNIKFSSSQILYKRKAASHSLKINGQYGSRLFYDLEYDEWSDEETLKEREWKNYILDLAFISQFNKGLKITLGLNAAEQQDLLQDKYGYRQYMPYAKFMLKPNKKIEIIMNVSAARRRHHTLVAEEDFDSLLVHDYLRGRVSVKWKLKKINLLIQARGVSRKRNFPEEATSFLAYNNAIADLGITYKLF